MVVKTAGDAPLDISARLRWWKDTQGIFHQTSAATTTPHNNGTIAPLPSFTSHPGDAEATAHQQDESNGTGDDPLATTPKIGALQLQQQRQVAPPSTAASRDTAASASVVTDSSACSPKSGSKGRKESTHPRVTRWSSDQHGVHPPSRWRTSRRSSQPRPLQPRWTSLMLHAPSPYGSRR